MSFNDNSIFCSSVKLVYVLELEDDCIYIGITTNLNLRLAQHITGEGAIWTRLHKVIGVIEVMIGTRAIEDEVTKEYIKEYGEDKVKGGSWCKTCKTIKLVYWLKQIIVEY